MKTPTCYQLEGNDLTCMADALRTLGVLRGSLTMQEAEILSAINYAIGYNEGVRGMEEFLKGKTSTGHSVGGEYRE